MITRTSRQLESTVASYSRQALPRPARNLRPYSKPSNRVNAPALATAPAHPQSYPNFMPSPEKAEEYNPEMQGFLRRRIPYTVLPTPLPDDRASASNDYYFTDSPTQDLLAIMDACLHNLYDVPRAKQVFERLRRTRRGDPIMESRLYNLFLDAYLEMASTKESDNKVVWLEDMLELYNAIIGGVEKVAPTANTYATMLLAWLRFGPDSPTPVDDVPFPTVHTLLTDILEHNISVSSVVSDRAFKTSEDASAAITLLSRVSVELGKTAVVHELGLAEAMGSTVDPLENVPEVAPVLRPKPVDSNAEVKEGEIAEPAMEVPFNLSNLRKHLAQVALARRVLPEDVASRQKLLEESVYEVAVERLKYQADLMDQLGVSDKGLRRPELQRWMWDWHQKLEERLRVEMKDIHQAEKQPLSKLKNPDSSTHTRISAFLSLIKPEKLSLITILEIMRLQGSGGIADGMKTARALIAVGRAVENEYKAEMCRKNDIQVPSHPRLDHGYFTHLGYRDLYQRRVAARKYMEDAEEWTSEWTQLLRVRVGSILVECLMDVATVTRTGINKRTGQEVTEEQPAFFHTYEYQRGQKLGVIRLNTVVAEAVAKDTLREALHPRHLPMLVKPKPWVNHDQGGYLFNKTSAMRFKDSQEQQSYLRHAAALGNVELVFAGLDVLGSTPWQINRQVFDVVLEVWNSGKRLCKVPPAVYEEQEPEKPANFSTEPQVRSVYLQRLKAYTQGKANNHSDRCNVNYKIEIARAFLGDTMYLPHNLDFRGRAYPIPPHLNHIGDDLSRGLLKFGEAKPLGVRGLRWLKIHLANLYGFDKANFDERENFVHEHLAEIYDSAEKPLEGKRWWTTADDPWQCLATCMELRAALESPDPHAFMSSLPVHQDGTCNGLQHYAALGGDAQGAQQVNLSVTDRPSDVYTFVATMVEKAILEDIEKGKKEAQWARLLSGKVSRKVVKQTVMTTVYGVTFIGAREQIEKQLKDRKDIPEEDCWPAASYLAQKTLACIGDLFTSAKDIQNWLNLCARLISKAIPEDRLSDALATYKGRGKAASSANRIKKEQMTSVVWTTPLGLPIVQPYRKTKRKQFATSLQTVFISDPNNPAEVNSVKQASAFPPNFIHSLDATHMMLTALECRTRDLTFASVHDSYWTHASTIDDMSEVIRETFIALHSSDVLVKLQEEFKERYKGYKVPLGNIRLGSLPKALAKAGTKVVVSSEQSQALPGVGEFLSVDDTRESALKVATDATSVEPDTVLDNPALDKTARVRVTRYRPNQPEGAIAEEEAAEEVEVEEADDAVQNALAGKFVDLVDLLPPLPEKGGFEVKTIKNSQYFFS